LRESGLAAIRESALPAYLKFTAFVKDEYAPKGRLDPGIWALPDGVARYNFRIKESTTTSLSAEEIHQIGLAQVKEIEGRMLGVAQQLGFKDLKSFNAAVTVDPKLHAHSRAQILDLYRKYTDQMYTKLAELFGRLPKAKVEIMPIEEFNEKDASTHYNPAAQDGSRPAHVMVNTGEPEKQLLLDVETTSYHEGVPGHHMQLAIAQELDAAVEAAAAEVERQHKDEVEAFDAEMERLGYSDRDAQRMRRRIDERHKRETRRTRIDLLIEGVTAIESVYRDALASPAGPLNRDMPTLSVSPRAAAEALSACRKARDAFLINEKGLVRLVALLMALPPAGAR
jgi:hypothetical protein